MVKWIIICVISAVLVFGVIPFIILSTILYRILLVRTSKKKWSREWSVTNDEEYAKMYELGEKWGEEYDKQKEEVEITNGKYKLCGQYFNFGNKKAVIIIAGRMEACRYCCYFAEPYREKGYNVLVIDNRSHGNSSGKYNNLGFKEYTDVIEWSKFLHDKKDNDKIFIHGICIGSATALYAMTNENCPNYVLGMVAEGMFTTFRDSFNNHLKKDKHPRFPISPLVMLYISLHSHKNAFKDGPIKRIKDMKKPVLFLYGKEDLFSMPKEAEKLYNACESEKRIVWFDKGDHSRLRINDKEKYDNAIKDFLDEYIKA